MFESIPRPTSRVYTLCDKRLRHGGSGYETSEPLSQENWTPGNFDAATIFPRKFDRLNVLKRPFFLRIYGRF